MTSAGKKLQDIYDSGAKTLIELQAKTSKHFEESSKEHTTGIQQSAEKSLLSLQDKSNTLQTELKGLLHGSLKRLETALQEEHEQNRAFVKGLVSELQTRTEQMRSKLASLDQSHHENVDFAFHMSQQNYLNNLEAARVNLDENTAQVTTSFNSYGTTVGDKLSQTIEQSLQQQHEQSQESNSTFFTNTREQKELISNHGSRLAQSFTSNCQSKLGSAKGLANKTAQDAESSIHELLDTVAKHASLMETESNTKYKIITDSHFQAVDGRLSEFADELSSLHDNIVEQLLKETEELSSDLLSASTQAQDGLRDKCDKTVNTVGSEFSGFKQRLDTRLQMSRGQRQTLEDDKNKILIAIKNELLSIHDSFAKKISSLLTEAKGDVASMTKSIETKIMNAMETYNEQVTTSATAVQKQIEDEVTTFLRELSKTRAAAVEEITSSAKGSLPLVNIQAAAAQTGIEDKQELPIEAQTSIDELSSENQLDDIESSVSKSTKRSRRQKSDNLSDEKDETEREPRTD